MFRSSDERCFVPGPRLKELSVGQQTVVTVPAETWLSQSPALILEGVFFLVSSDRLCGRTGATSSPRGVPLSSAVPGHCVNSSTQKTVNLRSAGAF